MKFAEQVRQAYERTGLLPARGAFMSRRSGDDRDYGCGLGAYVLASEPFHEDDNESVGLTASHIFLNAAALDGFILGFDGLACTRTDERAFVVWHAIGVEAAALCGL